MSHTLDLDRIDEVYDTINQHLERLNSWELKFIDSTSEQWTSNGKLSERQLELLEKIYLKV